MRELLEMFNAHQRDRWDHTAQLLAAWSGKAIDPRTLNPYRKKERRRQSMPAAELYAIQAAIDRRKERRQTAKG